MNANRRFLAKLLGQGLELELATADDVLRHVTPEVLAHHLPVALKTKLLAASLGAKDMNPALVVETLGVDSLAEHAPAPLLWAAARDAMGRALGDAEGARPGAKKEATADPATKADGEPDATKPAKAAKPAGDAAAPATDAAKPAADDGKPPAPPKPNRSTRPSRVRAGATSRRRLETEPQDEDDENVFDVDTRVGEDAAAASDFDVIEESELFEEGSTAVRGDRKS